MARSGLIEGLFLSSGIGSSIRETMTRMIDTARILRERYLFEGYLHLKILPGASIDLIEAAGQFADRLSVNMEAPTESALRDIAPNKGIESSIIKQMQWVETLRRIGRIPKRVGQVTQFVVGGSDDPGANDRALVVAANYLYRELDFRRIYYSPFNPVIGTPLEGRPPENPVRSHRLYQADFLIKQYGWTPDDIIFDRDGRLDLEIDPKEKWAWAHPEIFPVEITTADLPLLLKVPGIGPVTSMRILKARTEGRLRCTDDLLALGQVPRKSLKWVLTNGKLGEIAQPVVRGWDSPQLKLPYSCAS
jgi:predicted DNA-binding helix-hairpin-helix protein